MLLLRERERERNQGEQDLQTQQEKRDAMNGERTRGALEREPIRYEGERPWERERERERAECEAAEEKIIQLLVVSEDDSVTLRSDEASAAC